MLFDRVVNLVCLRSLVEWRNDDLRLLIWQQFAQKGQCKSVDQLATTKQGDKVSTTIQEGTEGTDTMISGGYHGLDRTLYQEMKSYGQGQQQQDKVTTGMLIDSDLI